ncbi:MAG TPA: hypothetical protein VHS59_03600, partial [Bacillota bacterium]|nr:hypothetical protein [Bacillota bacterium]
MKKQLLVTFLAGALALTPFTGAFADITDTTATTTGDATVTGTTYGTDTTATGTTGTGTTTTGTTTTGTTDTTTTGTATTGTSDTTTTTTTTPGTSDTTAGTVYGTTYGNTTVTGSVYKPVAVSLVKAELVKLLANPKDPDARAALAKLISSKRDLVSIAKAVHQVKADILKE